jgi:simple sugar transport system ATP-binding protein
MLELSDKGSRADPKNAFFDIAGAYVLFGMYQPEKGRILKNGREVKIDNPNDANALGIGMVHQHFKLVEVFTVLDNIILGAEDTRAGFLEKAKTRKKVMELSERYALRVDPDAKIEDISVGMQQRVEILKMLYRDNEILILDEPTAVLTPQEIEELMEIMRSFAREGKSILFITHKLNEIMAVADRVTVLRKGRRMGTVDIKDTTKEELSRMMVGRDVSFTVEKADRKPGEVVLSVRNFTVKSRTRRADSVKTSPSTCARARSSASRASKATARPSLSPRSPALRRRTAERSRSWGRTLPPRPSGSAAFRA